MGNCLISKLKGATNNSSLPTFDAFTINVKATTGTNFNDTIELRFVRSDSGKRPVIKGIGDTFYINGVEYSEYLMDLSGSMRFWINQIKVKNTDYKIEVSDLYEIDSISSGVGDKRLYKPIFTYDLSQIKYAEDFKSLFCGLIVESGLSGKLDIKNVSALTEISMKAEEVFMDCDFLFNANVLTTLRLKDLKAISNLNKIAALPLLSNLLLENVTFDAAYNLSVFNNLTKLTNLDVNKSNISGGEVNDLLTAQAQATDSGGNYIRHSGETLTINIWNTNCTYNGLPYSSNIVATFNGSGGYSVS